MKANAIEKWLSKLGVSATNKGSGWVESKCPLAPWRHRSGIDRNPSFGVKVMPGDSQVWCFSCQYGGTQTTLLYELEHCGHEFNFAEALRAITLAGEGEDLDDIEFEYEEARATEDLYEFPEWYIGGFESAVFGTRVHPYLESRNVSVQFATAYDLRFDAHRHRICFPIRDYRGRLMGVHGRAISDLEKSKYYVYKHEGHSNQSVWLGEHLVDREEPVVLVESVFDLASTWEVYENVLTYRSAGVNAGALARINWASTIICFFDNDEAGKMGVERVRDGFRDTRTRVHAIWPPEGKDPGDMAEYDIAELLHPYVGD